LPVNRSPFRNRIFVGGDRAGEREREGAREKCADAREKSGEHVDTSAKTGR
jgi:hypothetical protein